MSPQPLADGLRCAGPAGGIEASPDNPWTTEPLFDCSRPSKTCALAATVAAIIAHKAVIGIADTVSFGFVPEPRDAALPVSSILARLPVSGRARIAGQHR